MRLGSLFSGYGGLDLAVASLTGATTAWVSDIDKGACKILAHRFPDAPNLGDISTVDWSAVEPIDILTGGFPCQDVSHAGKRAGLRPDTRSGLWTQMAYAIDQLRPRLVVAENVRGLLSASAHSDVEPCPFCLGDRPRGHLRALGAVLGDLADLGYDARWYGLRAADVGAPHGRFRVFVAAYPRGETWEFGTGLREGEATGNRRRQPARGGRPDGVSLLPTPSAALASGGQTTRGGDRSGELLLSGVAESLLPTPRATDGTKGGPNQRGSSGDLMLPSAVTLLPTPMADDARRDPAGVSAAARVAQGHQASLGGIVNDLDLLPTPTVQDGKNNAGPSQFDRNTLPLNAEVMRLLPTPMATDAAGSGNRPTDKASHPGTSLTDATVREPQAWGAYGPAIARWEELLGRLAAEPTEPTGKNGARRLAPAFVEWMMGLPAGWITDVPDITRNEALKACGNGVVPQQAIAALRVLFGAGSEPHAASTTLLPTPNPFHAGNEEEPQAWRERRADVFKRTGTRHGPALGVVAKSIADGDPLTPDRYMPDEDEEVAG